MWMENLVVAVCYINSMFIHTSDSISETTREARTTLETFTSSNETSNKSTVLVIGEKSARRGLLGSSAIDKMATKIGLILVGVFCFCIIAFIGVRPIVTMRKKIHDRRMQKLVQSYYIQLAESKKDREFNTTTGENTTNLNDTLQSCSVILSLDDFSIHPLPESQQTALKTIHRNDGTPTEGFTTGQIVGLLDDGLSDTYLCDEYEKSTVRRKSYKKRSLASDASGSQSRRKRSSKRRRETDDDDVGGDTETVPTKSRSRRKNRSKRHKKADDYGDDTETELTRSRSRRKNSSKRRTKSDGDDNDLYTENVRTESRSPRKRSSKRREEKEDNADDDNVISLSMTQTLTTTRTVKKRRKRNPTD